MYYSSSAYLAMRSYQVCQCLTFEEVPPLTEEDSKDENLPTPDLDDPVWSEELVPDSWAYMCIHEVPRLATSPKQPPPQPIPATLLSQLDQELPVTPPPQPDQVEMLPDYELMDLDITEYILVLLNVPQNVMSDFNAWAQDVFSYQW